MIKLSNIGLAALLTILIIETPGPVFGALSGVTSTKREAKARLKADLKNHNSSLARINPADDVTNLVDLAFSICVYAVLKLDEMEQSITTVNYIQLEWNDTALQWNTSDYSEINKITLGYDELWFPKVIVTNTAQEDNVVLRGTTDRLSVYSNGLIKADIPAILRTTCSLDLKYYPMDTQVCELVFLPFFDDCHYSISSIRYLHLADAFKLKGEWTIEKREVMEAHYQIDSAILPLIKVKLYLRRARLYYIISIFLPMIVTSFMASLVFWIPPGSGEKVSFLVSLFISNAVFLNFIVATMPRSLTDMPRLTLFLCVVIVECFLAFIATLFVIRRYHEEIADSTNRSSDDVIFEQMPMVVDPRERLYKELFTTKDSLGAPFSEHEKANDIATHKSRLKHPMKTNGQRKGSKIAPAETLLFRKRLRIPNKPNRRIGYQQWDKIFFVAFHVTSAPFYVFLFVF